MNKAARVLSIVVVALVATSVVVSTGWFVRAQDVQQPPAPQISEMEQRGRELMQQVESLAKGNKASLYNALSLSEQIEAECPNTDAATDAAIAKAEILCDLQRPDAAYAALQPLVTTLAATSPDSERTKRAKTVLAETLVSRARIAFEKNIRSFNKGKELYVSWDTVRGYIDEVLALDSGRRAKAAIRWMQVTLETYTGNPGKADQLAKAFLAKNGDMRMLQKEPVEVMNLHIAAAIAAYENGDSPRTLSVFERIKAMYTQLPESKKKQAGIQRAYQEICYLHFSAMRWAHVDPAQMRAAGEEVIAMFPGSDEAKGVQLKLERDATRSFR